MARLPIVDGDDGNWGTILNDYLSQSLKTDGTIKDNAVTSNTIASGAVTSTTISDSTSTGRAVLTAASTSAARTAIALGNVDNTSDANKPVSTATQTALDLKLAIASADANYAKYINVARNPELIFTGAITRNDDGAPTGATVTWPDGSTGTYTATTVSTDFPGAVDAYTVTYGSPVTRTYTQSAVTRDENTGLVTNIPAIGVS